MLLARVEHVDFHGKLPPEEVEQGADELFPQLGWSATERRRDLVVCKPGLPQLSITEQPVVAGKSLIVEP